MMPGLLLFQPSRRGRIANKTSAITRPQPDIQGDKTLPLPQTRRSQSILRLGNGLFGVDQITQRGIFAAEHLLRQIARFGIKFGGTTGRLQ